MSALAQQPAGKYDSAKRRKAKRSGRETGCWVYLPDEELRAAGIDPAYIGVGAPAPRYTTQGKPHSKRTGRVLVNLWASE